MWWAIANILGNKLGASEHAKNALRAWGVHTLGTWCEHIWLTTWCAPCEKTLRTSKSKKFKTLINSQKEKILILGCMLCHLIGKIKFLFTKMFVVLFHLDLIPHSLISLKWTIIFYTTLNVELVICLVNNQSTLKTLWKPKKNSMISSHTRMHATWPSNL